MGNVCLRQFGRTEPNNDIPNQEQIPRVQINQERKTNQEQKDALLQKIKCNENELKVLKDSLKKVDDLIQHELKVEFRTKLVEVRLEGEFEHFNTCCEKIFHDMNMGLYYYKDGNEVKLFGYINDFVRIGDYKELRRIRIINRKRTGNTQLFEYKSRMYIYEFKKWVDVTTEYQ